MDDFDIVLFSPPSRMVNHYRTPVGLLYIAGYLTYSGLKVKIIDVPLKEQIRDKRFFDNIEITLRDVYNTMLTEFKKIKTKIVGISCYTPEYFEVMELAKAVKGLDKSITIIVGGIHPTFYPEEFIDKESPVDICVIGEGEITAYELCQSILSKSGKDLSEVEGIAYLDKRNQKLFYTQKRMPAENLDEISFPDYSLVDMQYYTNASPYAIRGIFLRSMYLLATRGCPSQCTFCVAKKMLNFFGGVRIRSAESLIRELKGLKEKYAIDSFYFIDDLFTINKDNVRRFCNLLKKENLDIVWGCSSRISTVNEEILKTMAESGCIQIDFGVERGSDEALRMIKKGQSVEMIKNIFNLCHKYGIRTFANMLVNLPGETEKDLDDILKLLDQIKPEIVSLNIFTPYPGTQIYEESEYKFKKEEYASLSKDVTQLIKKYPDKFKYSLHDIDLGEWVRCYSRKYNKISSNLKFYLTKGYWNILLKSDAKINYLKQFNLLVREFINQKL